MSVINCRLPWCFIVEAFDQNVGFLGRSLFDQILTYWIVVVLGGKMECGVSVWVYWIYVYFALLNEDLYYVKMARPGGIMKRSPLTIVLAVKHILLVDILFNIPNHFLKFQTCSLLEIWVSLFLIGNLATSFLVDHTSFVKHTLRLLNDFLLRLLKDLELSYHCCDLAEISYFWFEH